ncbi:hypothetical protein [Kibdelosporangium philippinense]|uniref:hypothetical protein n=1 Tax=Kibdelosporangium philippinense TaxID=211113 RepID=UPI0036239B99
MHEVETKAREAIHERRSRRGCTAGRWCRRPHWPIRTVWLAWAARALRGWWVRWWSVEYEWWRQQSALGGGASGGGGDGPVGPDGQPVTPPPASPGSGPLAPPAPGGGPVAPSVGPSGGTNGSSGPSAPSGGPSGVVGGRSAGRPPCRVVDPAALVDLVVARVRLVLRCHRVAWVGRLAPVS